MDLTQALRDVFGYDGFRTNQELIISQVMAGADVLAVLPTGAGKSLCYQLPAALLPGPTLVISPLISLMKDQFDNLPPALHCRSTIINSSVPPDEVRRRLDAIADGSVRLIYAAPERLRQQGFLRLMAQVGLALVVVDEAHCVSVWGHDFRPDFLFIRKALAHLADSGKRPTLLAVTATATPEMQREVQAQFGRSMQVVVSPLFRPNLHLEAVECANKSDKTRALVQLCKSTQGAGIVYAASRAGCEDLAMELCRSGIAAEHYHAGMDAEARRLTQERFMLGRTRIVAATIAFGMGIDKANVRLVAHFMLPRSLESYMQEVGRAGRDGKPSRCVLFFTSADQGNLSRWMKDEVVSLDDARATYHAIRGMLAGGQTSLEPDALTDAAFGMALDEDKSTAVRVAIAAMEACGMLVRHADYGRNLVVELLKAPPGARRDLDALLERRRAHALLRLDAVVHYARSERCRHAALVRHFGQEMEACRTACDRCDAPGASAPASGRTSPRRAERRPAGAEAPSPLDPAWATPTPAEDDRFEVLRAWRKKTASEQGVPAYWVASDATLRGVAGRNPKRMDQLAAVPGIGPQKLEKFGAAILEALQLAAGAQTAEGADP